MFNDVEHPQPANSTLSSLDKLPWQMRTVEFVRRLASVSVSDTVSFIDNLMKIWEARTSVVYSLRTDTHDLPSTHSPVLDDDADAVVSLLLLLLLLLPSLTWLSRQFQVQASCCEQTCCFDRWNSCPTSYPLGSNNYQAERWIAKFCHNWYPSVEFTYQQSGVFYTSSLLAKLP